MSRLWRVLALSWCLILISCQDESPTGPSLERPGATIVDAASGGLAGFYFLPPLVRNAAYSGVFDASLLSHTVVEVCEAAAEPACGPMVQVFTHAGSGSERLRIESDEGSHYHVNWHTRRYSLDAQVTYRIRVLVAGSLLGWADVDVVRTGSEKNQVDRSSYVPVLQGETVPIKFRIEEGAAFVIGAGGGTITALGGAVGLVIADGALDGPTGITIAAAPDVPEAGALLVGGTAFDFGPDGTQFDPPAQLTITYDEAALPDGVTEASLQLLKLVDGSWEAVAGSSVDADANTLTAPLSSFSVYTVGALGGVLPTLSAFGTATADGTLAAGEWTAADYADFFVHVPEGGTTPARLYVMNDDDNLYVALRFDRAAADPYAQLQLSFDNDRDLQTENGDDRLEAFWTPPVVSFQDGWWEIGGGCPSGLACAAVDVTAGGTQDGAIGADNDGTYSVIEFSHPLDSSDDAHDFSLGYGSKVALYIGLTLQGASSSIATTLYPSPGFIEITIATLVSGDLLSAGYAGSCAISVGPIVYCWGSNAYGAVGDGSQGIRKTPTKPLGPIAFLAVTSGAIHDGSGLVDGAHTCALTAAAEAYCWGLNGYGQVGDGTSGNIRTTPVAVTGGHAFVSISAGEFFTCGVTAAGAGYCWGANNYGQLGIGSQGNPNNTPQPVAGGLTFASIAAGGGHACGITTGGDLYCWGVNAYGQLGTGAQTVPVTSPTAVSGGSGFATVSAGSYHTCALKTAGQAYCWGANAYGNIGDGSSIVRTTPTAVSGGHTFAAIDAGTLTDPTLAIGGHTCGVTTGGDMYCWGANGYGALGDGTTLVRRSPVLVSGGHSWRVVTAGEQHTCGGTTAGALYCWGLNNYGQLGDGTQTVRHSPTLVFGGLTLP